MGGRHLLGHIGNEKPSAIYKIAKPKESALTNMFVGMQSSTLQGQEMAQIGISLEPVAEAAEKTSATIGEQPSTSKQSEMTPEPSESFVPLSSLQKWYETFQRRM